MTRKILLSFVKQKKLRTFVCFSVAILSIMVSLVPAQIIRIITDGYEKMENNVFVGLCILYTSSYVLTGLFNFLKNYLLVSFSQKTFAFMRSKMMNHYSRLDYRSLSDTNIGTFESYFGNDIDSLNSLFEDGIIDMFFDLLKVTGILISLFFYSYVFGLILLVVLPFVMWLTWFMQKRMLKAQKMVKSSDAKTNEVLYESIENISQIKINHASPYSIKRYSSILVGNYKASKKSYLYDAIFSPIMQMIRCLVITMALLASGYSPNLMAMTTGMIISSLSLISDLFAPIENIGVEIQTIQQSIASYQRIEEFMKMNEVSTTDMKVNGFKIEFINCSYAYDDVEVIKDFNLVIEEKEKLILKGESGRGKSTLMKLALGLLKPTKGEVLVGGKPSYQLTDEERRRLLSVVYQDTFFNGDSIYDELTLLDHSISKERVREVLNQVGLTNMESFDDKLDPGEYSSGELQMLNIARAILNDSSIVFLDEMNSKIDLLTSNQIVKIIENAFKDKTIFSISHFGLNIDNSKIINI